MEIFSKRLKELREQRKLTQREIAKHFGISHASYGDYERGHSQPTLEMLVKIARFFGVTTSYILGEEDYS